MCLLLGVVLAFGPRLFLFFSWLFQWARFAPAFSGSTMFWNIVGWFFIPWTLLGYAFMYPIDGVESWILILLVIIDILNIVFAVKK